MSTLRWESALITKVIETKSLKDTTRLGITPDDFLDDESRAVWTYILRHYSDPNKGGVPSLAYIKSRFPDFDKQSSNDTLGAIVDRVKEGKLYADLRALMDETKGLAQQEDAFAAYDQLKSKVLSLNSRINKNGIQDATKLTASVRETYLKAKELKGITGMPFPWEQMTQDTGGAQEGDLITFAARPGSFKTWVLLAIAAYWHSLGYKPLILTKEMSAEQLTRRLVSIYAKVDYRKLRKGKLESVEEANFFDNLEAWAECSPFPIMNLKATGEAALVDIQSAVEDECPDALLIDGAYFICERDWAMTGKVTSGLKNFALNSWKIPVVLNTQLNQESEKNASSYKGVTGSAYGDSYGQDSDAYYKLRYTPDNRRMGELEIYSAKLREDSGKHFTIGAKPGADLAQRHLISEDWEGDENAAQTTRDDAAAEEIL